MVEQSLCKRKAPSSNLGTGSEGIVHFTWKASLHIFEGIPMDKQDAKKAFVDVAVALNQLAQSAGLEVHAIVGEVEPFERDVGMTEDGWEDYAAERKRTDFEWFQVYASSPEGRGKVEELKGNYVVIFNKKFLGFGPDKESLKRELSRKFKLKSEELLTLPLRIAGSNEDWQNVAEELGLTVDV